METYLVVACFVALFVWSAYRSLHLHLRGVRTTGVIVGMLRDDSGKQPTYNPVVEFTTKAGVLVQAKSGFGTPEARRYFRLGQRVEILYLSTDPQIFAIHGYETAGVFLLFLAMAFIVAIAFWPTIRSWVE